VICPPGELESLIFSEGTEDSVFPGFTGRFLPVQSFTTLADTCPPREVSSCSPCTCSSGSCFSCVIYSSHIGYKARQADDDDDNVKFPTYIGEKQRDDYIVDDTDSLFAMLDQAQSKVEKEDEYDILSLLEKDQEENVKMIRHGINEDKIEEMQEVAKEEEKAVSESIAQLVEASAEHKAELNAEAVKAVNDLNEAEEKAFVGHAIDLIEKSKEAPKLKDAEVALTSLEAQEKLALENAEKNRASVLSVNNADVKEEGAVMQAISKIKANLKDPNPTLKTAQDKDKDVLALMSGFQHAQVDHSEQKDIMSVLQGYQDSVVKNEKEEVLDMLVGFDKAVAADHKHEEEEVLKELADTAKVVQDALVEDTKKVVADESTDILDVMRDFENSVAQKQHAETSEMIAESECFMCSGFTDQTCALALTTVISDLNDKERLALEKELLDQDGSTCGNMKDQECLISLDVAFSTMETSEKVELLGTMCDLVTTRSSTRTSLKLGQHTGRDTVVEEKPVKRYVKATKPVLLDEPTKKDTNTVAKVKEVTKKDVSKPASYSPQQVTKQRVDSCAICAGFSSQTCALALTNVISGLNDKSRLSIEKELLDKDESTCGSLKDKDCLVILDTSFTSLETPDKVHLVENMCDLLTAADIPSSSTNKFDQAAMTDDAVAKTTHTLNTREALLNFDSKIVKSSLLHVNVKMDALIAGLSSFDEPQCLVCNGLDDRVCLAHLESSLSVLTDSQRLIVLARTMGAFPAYVSCDTEGDKACLKKLDKTYRKLAPSHKLSVLKDACVLGAYGTAAASLAAISSSAEVVTDVKQAMSEWAYSTTPEVHVMISKAASAAADLLAVRGGVISLQGGRAAKLMHTLTSWTTTVSTLATDVVPVVTETKDTSVATGLTNAAATGIASKVRSLVTLASSQVSQSEGGASKSDSSSISPGGSVNMASSIGESVVGFIVGAVSAVGLVYTVIAVRRSFSKKRLYSKIPDDPKQNDKNHEPPAFVLSF
jgi:CHASE3 domain sensor protein